MDKGSGGGLVQGRRWREGETRPPPDRPRAPQTAPIEPNLNLGSSPEAIKKIQEAAKINISVSSELLSLYASEPPGLRVPAAKCLGGIREAQTIIYFELSPPQKDRVTCESDIDV